MRYLMILFVLMMFEKGFTQDATDILHYKFQLVLSDASDSIKGNADISLRLTQPTSNFSLDLQQRAPSGKGMIVRKVTGKGVAGFRQQNNQLFISLSEKKQKPDSLLVHIQYEGIPDDGLIISKNRYNERTFFADNWPNRAHHWLPCKDNPADKASFEFIVTAPYHYKVISNGTLVAETISGSFRTTHWNEAVALSTKVMVIGVARFSVFTYEQHPSGIPVSAWVYPEDSVRGIFDYGVAPRILEFFSGYIGPYPYEKLANVQSKTIFGGMENASAIFYAEQSVTGDRKWEEVLAHEIAHQWFGDMASEKSFAHLWLSEGFATYMTNMYITHQYGKDSTRKRLNKDRNDILAFVQTNHHAIVDSTKNLMSLLNANSYQKGGWVLHMLHIKFGDSIFHEVIKNYYQAYKGANAETRDFERIAEKVSRSDLHEFFNQWLYEPGIPVLSLNWSQNEKGLSITVKQHGRIYHDLPLQVGIETDQGKLILKNIQVNNEVTSTNFEISGKVLKVIADPEVQLLFKEVE